MGALAGSWLRPVGDRARGTRLSTHPLRWHTRLHHFRGAPPASCSALGTRPRSPAFCALDRYDERGILRWPQGADELDPGAVRRRLSEGADAREATATSRAAAGAKKPQRQRALCPAPLGRRPRERRDLLPDPQQRSPRGHPDGQGEVGGQDGGRLYPQLQAVAGVCGRAKDNRHYKTDTLTDKANTTARTKHTPHNTHTAHTAHTHTHTHTHPHTAHTAHAHTHTHTHLTHKGTAGAGRRGHDKRRQNVAHDRQKTVGHQPRYQRPHLSAGWHYGVRATVY